MRNIMPSMAIIQAAAVQQPLDNPLKTISNSLWDKVPEELTNPFEQLWISKTGIECSACKLGAWTFRETIGRKHVQNLITDAVIVICGYFVEDFGFKRDVCPGIIKQQVGDSILPILGDKLADEKTMCSFIFNVCDMEKYIIQDAEQWVYDVLLQKPEAAAKNNYVNKMYQ